MVMMRGVWWLVLVLTAQGCFGRPSTRNTTPIPAQARVGLEAAPPGALRFAVVGDFGNDSAQEAQVAALVTGWDPAFVVTTGDNNYPFGLALTIDDNIGRHYGSFIGNYRGQYGKGATENRFFPTPGNHDWYNPTGLSPYTDYFTLPGNERYYDVVKGGVHILALDSDTREPDGVTWDSRQGKWAAERLAASEACFRFVFFHHPPYSSGLHGNTEHMRWPFKAWRVDAVLAGHDHTYERLDVDGIPYFVNGLGGASPYEMRERVQPESKVRFNAAHGAMLITVTDTGADLEFRDVENRVVDHHRLEKNCLVPAP